MNLRPARVGMDGVDGLFACLLEDGDWNGFACPWFTKQESERIMEALTKAPSPVATSGIYSEAGDSFLVELEGDMWIFKGEVHNGLTLYPIGTRGWCWGEEPFEYTDAIDIIRGLIDEIDRCGVVVSPELEAAARNHDARATAIENRKGQTWETYNDEVQRLAAEFDIRLKTEIGETDYAWVIEANRAELDPNVCHSGDFCDSNVVMAAAFKHVTGYESATDNDYDTQLWNDAWNTWKASKRGGAQ